MAAGGEERAEGVLVGSFEAIGWGYNRCTTIGGEGEGRYNGGSRCRLLGSCRPFMAAAAAHSFACRAAASRVGAACRGSDSIATYVATSAGDFSS